MQQLNLDFIKQKRKEKNFNLQEMAEALGYKNASTYMKCEKGIYNFKVEHLPILAEKLDCSINEFFLNNNLLLSQNN